MKKSINLNPKRIKFFKICLSLILILFTNQLFSSIITVDNNYPKIGDYATLQEAHDTASNGDTVYVFSSNVPYSSITISKRLTLVGSGFYETYPNSIKTTIISGSIICDPGSDYSTIEGFIFQPQNSEHTVGVTINASNINIKRNKLRKILINSNLIGTKIINNYIFDLVTANYNLGAVRVENFNEILISNNLIIRQSYNGTGNGIGIQLSGQNISGLVMNNVVIVHSYDHPSNIAIDLNTSNCSSLNNILVYGNCIGNMFSFNICDGGKLSSGNGNILNSSVQDIFIDFSSGNYHLKPGSPAIGSGLNGVDMGIYGGEFPFVDRGYPSIPSIYYLDVPLTGTQKDGINVTIKVKSNQ